MRIRSFWSLCLLGAMIITTACETDNPKKAATTPPPQATAPTLATPQSDAAPATAPVATAAPAGDSVTELIAKAEKEFKAGQSNYAAGHLEAAKDNFDQAFKTMLSSNLDVHSDERLENEFDKIVESVHELELQALKEGDGFTEQKSEPAPIDEANEVTFPVDPNIKAQALAEIRQTRSDLPLVMNDQIAGYISYFSSRAKGTLANGMARSGMYREMIQRVLKEEGVPQDLIYLAQAESGFRPLALSRAGARGMWQFMASRGGQYGLDRNWWVDDRQDPEKATRAAARHLKDLYHMFGDWYLAMAAYNSGPLTVQRAVQRTGYADFWELYKRGVLPGETKNYVPIIIAITIMSKNPAQYGLTEVQFDAAIQGDSVTIDYPVDLRLVAECVDGSVSTLQELNPSLLRMTTPKDQSFTLHVPTGTKDKFEQNIAAIPLEKRVLWRFHRVQPGDTLASIAHKYHVSSDAIAEANDLPDEEVRTDAKLIIPVASSKGSQSASNEGGGYSKKPVSYKVRKGDTIASIADDFGVPADKIRRWNHISGDSVKQGRVLHIYKPTGDEEEASSTRSRSSSKKAAPELSSKSQAKSSDEKKQSAMHHTVKRGETLSSIANQYNTTVAELKKYNPNTSKLRPGDVLVIRR
ncbi:Lytic transglycosylase, catalytic [Candidatus Koribacter versatilis Ellin345]|uniref:Lytic transglycosylase, catalytic n=1 Tax=Koribacter versatilis (strain Ellin345) TaxID=204669 RepID=Q1IU96_KORVE|nr:LysM peptidoglycan-binding domain-containing protein [Candidatus Koribacter versatilis]ABF39554.1 Lytic transglycosylase, catalytic [Candidatus Koribacter versatilis Ellin345]